MFVNFFNTSMLLSRDVFRGAKGIHPPSWISEIYAYGGASPPPKKKKKCKPFLGKKKPEYAPLNIFKTMS